MSTPLENARPQTRLNMKARKLRNLSRRPPTPSKGRGPVQMACNLWAFGTASTSEIIDWAYVRQLLLAGLPRRQGFNRAVRRALKSIGAVRMGRARGARKSNRI